MAYISTRQTAPAVRDETVEYRAEKEKTKPKQTKPTKKPQSTYNLLKM